MAKGNGNQQQERGYWVVRTYKAGRVGEKIKYWVPGSAPTKSARKMKSDINKVKQNEYSAEKRVARLINANFQGGKDILLGLSYDDITLQEIKDAAAGAEDQEKAAYAGAHHQLRLFIRRARRACELAGIPFRYIAVTSDWNLKEDRPARLHHHLVINREALEICLSKWTAGTTNHEALDDDPDHSELAAYLIKQVRHEPDEKKYIPSRNLTIPAPKDRRAVSGAELTCPRGAVMKHRNEWQPGRPQYIRYVLSETPQKVDTTRARGGARTRTRSGNSPDLPPDPEDFLPGDPEAEERRLPSGHYRE